MATTEHLPYNDQPIERPSDDRFGVDPFARALAASIRKMQSPQGAVIGLNGPSGSGKSSAVTRAAGELLNHRSRRRAAASPPPFTN